MIPDNVLIRFPRQSWPWHVDSCDRAIARDLDLIAIMAKVQSDLANFIIDIEDENCVEFGLHLAAYQGDTAGLEQILATLDDDAERQVKVNARIRPFQATPLRLAATAGNLEAIRILLKNGAQIDLPDVKAQTPLFVAMVNRHWECSRFLLEMGADPDGMDSNLCSPLAVMAQRGHLEGVRILCQYGVDTEDTHRILKDLPGFPLTITAAYHRLDCFLLLLLHGALPDLREHSADLCAKYSIPHTIVKYRSSPEFVYAYWEFGGSLWIRDLANGTLATSLGPYGGGPPAPSLVLMRDLQGQVLSLQSLSRLSIRRALGPHRLHMIDALEVSNPLKQFLAFKELVLSASQVPLPEHLPVVRQLQGVLERLTQEGFSGPPRRRRQCKSQWGSRPEPSATSQTGGSLERDRRSQVAANPNPLVVAADPAAVVPQPPPMPPLSRPRLWRFPDAEFVGRGVFQRH